MSLKRIPPIIVRNNPPIFEQGYWIFELKYDGWRGMLYIENGHAYFVSRTGNVLHQFAKLAAEIAQELKVTDAIFDGEITTLDPLTNYSAGPPNTKGAKVYYMAFDLLWLNGEDLHLQSLLNRKARLAEIAGEKSSIQVVEHIETLRKEFIDLVQERDIQGIVAKRTKDPYLRSARWYKVLNPQYRKSSQKA
jgi:bifunctional non-homologous end joining protein LigD